MAKRHLRVADRLLESGQVKMAQNELQRGLKLLPKDPYLLLAQARVLLLLNGPKEAMSVLSGLDKESALAGKIGVLKGWALVATRKWDRAIQVLQAAGKLNPDRSESHYLLGVAYQQKGMMSDALKAFRSAFEATANGQRISSSLRGPASSPAKSKRQPTTRPAR